MDKLADIFALQSALQTRIKEERHLQDIPMEVWIQKELLALMSEMSEVLDEVNFKWWKNPQPINQNALKEELIDMLHFWVSMCLETGMTADEVHQRYVQKNQENHDRQSGTSQKTGYAVQEAE